MVRFTTRGGYSLTALDVERIAQEESLILFRELLVKILNGEALPRNKQDLTKGHYFSRKELDSFKDISNLNSTEDIDKRIHALWFPPYHGASIIIGGKRYSIVDDELLKRLGKLYGC